MKKCSDNIDDNIGRLHSIETMGLLDGPGVRTVFFLQGCPLRCAYCHNPDSQAFNAGQIITVDEVVDKVKRFRPYHGEEGGVTFSGGEPLSQGKFIYECCLRLKKEGINIAIDTSGFGDETYYSKIFPLIDIILLDIKAFDETTMNSLIKGKLETFLYFIKNIENWGFRGEIWLRHVMIPGFSDDEVHMHSFIKMAEPIWHLIGRVEILPYHIMGIEKYKELGRKYLLEGVLPMDKNRAKQLQRYANRLLSNSIHQKRIEKLEEESMNREMNSKKIFYTPEQKNSIKEELKKISLLKELSETEFEEVYNNIEIFSIKKGDYVFKTGDSSDCMYIIKKGHMKILENTSYGHEQILYIYHQGDFVGAFNLMYHKFYLYTGVATDDCEIISIPKEVFNKYMYQNPKVLHRLLKMSFLRIRWAEDLIQRLSTGNAAMKVAALLVRLTESFGEETEEGIRLDLSINKEEMGDYAGLSRETIARKLGEFRDVGYIDLIGTKVILIKDLEALKSYYC